MTAALRAVPDAGVSAGDGFAAYLATLDHPETAATHRQYGSILRRLAAFLGPRRDIAGVKPGDLGAWMKASFAGSEPRTWNLARTCLRSAWKWLAAHGYVPAGITDQIERRKISKSENRAIPGHVVTRLVSEGSLRDRALWKLIYDTAARETEVLSLSLDSGRIDFARRRAVVTRKGGKTGVITWSRTCAALLEDHVAGRTAGYLFPGREPGKHMSARRAQEIMRERTAGEPGGPWGPHGLRHAKLTALGEAGWSQAMLKAKSGHESDGSLAIYVHVGPDAMQAHEAELDEDWRD